VARFADFVAGFYGFMPGLSGGVEIPHVARTAGACTCRTQWRAVKGQTIKRNTCWQSLEYPAPSASPFPQSIFLTKEYVLT